MTWENECPECQGTILEYGQLILSEDSAQYAYIPIQCLSCGIVGKEWYILQYTGSTVDGKEDV